MGGDMATLAKRNTRGIIHCTAFGMISSPRNRNQNQTSNAIVRSELKENFDGRRYGDIGEKEYTRYHTLHGVRHDIEPAKPKPKPNIKRDCPIGVEREF